MGHGNRVIVFLIKVTFLAFSLFTVTIFISAINNDNFNRKATINNNAVAILTSLIKNLARLLVIEAVSFASYSVTYFRNV